MRRGGGGRGNRQGRQAASMLSKMRRGGFKEWKGPPLWVKHSHGVSLADHGDDGHRGEEGKQVDRGAGKC